MAETLMDQYVIVTLDDEKFALRIEDIHEIIRMQEITEVPNCKHYIEGVINLRGKILSVICLRKRFGMSKIVYTKATRIVVVNYGGEVIGIIVDGVDQVKRFNDIQPPPDLASLASGMGEAWIEGIGYLDDGLACILKMDRLLYE